MNTKLIAIALVIILVGGGGMMYLYNFNQEINSSNQVPYSPDLPNLASCTADNYDANNAWQITTVHDLNNLSTMSAADKTFEGKTIYLANDITYPANLTFTPIKSFSGIFDGMDHKISGINVSQETAAIINNLYGTIKNITFENGLISGSKNAGGIVYVAHGGSVIENCTNASRVEIVTSVDFTAIGGIVACVITKYGEPTTTRISNCVNLGEIHLENSRSHDSGKVYDNRIGGILGYHSEYAITIDNCSNKGNISITKNGNYVYAGGIAGSISNSYSSILSNCHNAGNISAYATGTGAVKIGGILGSGTPFTDNCVNEGEISGNSTHEESNLFVAGIILDNNATNCHNYGNISASAGANAYADGIAYHSPSFGSPDPVVNCSNHGDVKAVKTSSSNGYYAKANGISSSAIYCYNTGDVSAISETHGGYYKTYTYASGVALNKTIGSFNTGTVIARDGDENIAGGISAGGGVSHSYNIGLVVTGDIGTSKLYPISASFVNSYYLKGVVPEDTTGVLTLEEMTSDSFVNLVGKEHFDKNRINFRVNGELYAYPVLAWQTYYANFVEFDSNGGSEVEAQHVTSGDVATYPDIPTKQNKVFYYWKDSNGQEYDFDTIVSSDLKLTAEWYDRLMFISYPPQVV